MLEFQLARKYLLPSRRKLSASLISILSCTVISLVIWLLLLFLSVTEGIEKNWLTRMTTLNSQIRIVPTREYFNSYYYQVDSISSNSQYHYKTIKEKLLAPSSDPYDPDVDQEPPLYWPAALRSASGEILDIVKTAFGTIESTGAKATDYEVTTAMLRLQLLRKKAYAVDESYISQASYLTNFSEKSDQLGKLLLKPEISDINHLLYLSQLSDFETLSKRILSHVSIKELSIDPAKFNLPEKLLPQETPFTAFAYFRNGVLKHIILPLEKGERLFDGYEAGVLKRLENGVLHFTAASGTRNVSAPLFLKASPKIYAKGTSSDIKATFTLQGIKLEGTLPFEHLQIKEATIAQEFDAMPEHEPLWPYTIKGEVHIPKAFGAQAGILVPKALKNSGVKIGDKGTLSYASFTGTSSQEMKQPIFVAGFYDPGAMAIGSRYILAAEEIVSRIAAANTTESLDPMMSSGIQVFVKEIKETPKVVAKIKSSFEKLGIAPYFRVIPYYEFEFARDLILQLQSDRYLFTLVGIIILAVASSNIISLLLLLVNDKRREIGILKAMGASTKNIVTIFALCGLLLGMMSLLIGTGAAYLTLKNIDTLANFLSMLQGHQAFNSDIYGQHLPNEISQRALIVIAIATPIVSLIAGLIPAIRAARLNPCDILRRET